MRPGDVLMLPERMLAEYMSTGRREWCTSRAPAAVGGGGITLRLFGFLSRSSSILTYGPVWSTVRLHQEIFYIP